MPKSLGTDSISDMAKFQECGELEMEIEHKSTTDDTVRWTVNVSHFLLDYDYEHITDVISSHSSTGGSYYAHLGSVGW